MELYNLAKRIAKWLWEYGDSYEMRDNGIDNYGDLVTETTITLSISPELMRDYLEIIGCPLYKEITLC